MLILVTDQGVEYRIEGTLRRVSSDRSVIEGRVLPKSTEEPTSLAGCLGRASFGGIEFPPPRQIRGS